MAEFKGQFYERLRAESVAAYRQRIVDEDDGGWKPWMRKAKRPTPEGPLCPTCHTKRGLTGECFCT